MDDLLIRQATLYDGSGADPMRADLAVRAGRSAPSRPRCPETPSKSSTPTASR